MFHSPFSKKDTTSEMSNSYKCINIFVVIKPEFLPFVTLPSTINRFICFMCFSALSGKAFPSVNTVLIGFVTDDEYFTLK